MKRLAVRLEEHQRSHAEVGRPGRQLTPWLGTGDVGPVVSAAYRSAFEERGRFYAEFVEIIGADFAPGVDARAMAGTLNAVSVVSDYFVRTAHDRDLALKFVAKQVELMHAGFVV